MPSQPQEVPQKLMAVLGGDGLWMELHAVYRELPVLECAWTGAIPATCSGPWPWA